VNEMMQTNLANIFAAGDIRSNSWGQIVTAVGDGATAAISVQRLIETTVEFLDSTIQGE